MQLWITKVRADVEILLSLGSRNMLCISVHARPNNAVKMIARSDIVDDNGDLLVALLFLSYNFFQQSDIKWKLLNAT